MEGSIVGEINRHKANVQVLCAYRGMTFSDLARLIGWTPSAVHVILSRRNPTVKNLQIIADALGTTIDALRRPVTLKEYAQAMVPRHKED